MPGADLYTFSGKEVLCGREHYADAANELAAEVIVGALNCHAGDRVPVLRRRDAEQVGAVLRDKLPTLTGSKGAPLAEDDPAWADIVQFVLRQARDLAGGRGQ